MSHPAVRGKDIDTQLEALALKLERWAEMAAKSYVARNPEQLEFKTGAIETVKDAAERIKEMLCLT